MQTTRRTLLATGAALPLLGLRQARAARHPGHLVMGISGYPSTLAPWTNAGTVAHNAKQLIFRGLLGYGDDGEMRGELAERWEREDETTWVFHLRDAVFHNGQKVTSDDIRYSIEQIGAEKSVAFFKGEAQRIARLDTPDAKTVRVHMTAPSVVVPDLFASYFMPMVAKGSVDRGGAGIGAGPFELVGQERGVSIDLKAFDKYYRPGLPKLRTIRLQSYADENLRVSALQAGDVDLIEYVPWQAMQSIEDDPKLKLETTEGPFMYMYFNAKSGPFSDVRVRRAAAIGVKRDEIVKVAFFGRGKSLEGMPIPKNSPFYNEAKAHAFAYDPARAKALMAEAGMADGFDCKLLATSTYGMIKSTAEVVQANLADIGIRATLVLPDWPTRITLGNRGQYDIAINGTTNESNDPDGMSKYLGTDLPVSYTRRTGCPCRAWTPCWRKAGAPSTRPGERRSTRRWRRCRWTRCPSSRCAGACKAMA